MDPALSSFGCLEARQQTHTRSRVLPEASSASKAAGAEVRIRTCVAQDEVGEPAHIDIV
jgi:hypothetical protein